MDEKEMTRMIEIMDRHIEVLDLFSRVEIPPNLRKYFDYESQENLDEKYRILKKIESGEPVLDADPDHILLELMPPKGDVWD